MSYRILKKLREKATLTQKQVAEALCVDTSTYAKIEQGRNRLVDAYYQTLADIFSIDIIELFRLYTTDEKKGRVGGGIDMSLTINKVLDFGSANYIGYYDDMYEEFGFAIKNEKAQGFMDYIENTVSIINNALTQIDKDSELISQMCYDDRTVDDGNDYVEFWAEVPEFIKINGRWVLRNDNEGDMLSRILHEINDLNPKEVLVKCKMKTGKSEETEVLQLKLVEIEIDEKVFKKLNLETQNKDRENFFFN